jgi:biopolymer transport protein ExbD
MARIKPKKHSTFIDMTAMSDVTVLLLTFFMLTANFIPQEPVQVITPSSISETKIPEANLMTILIDPKGKVFMSLDRKDNKLALLERIGKDYNINFTPEQKMSFVNLNYIGVPVGVLQNFLELKPEDQEKAMKQFGIPADSTNNQLKVWVQDAFAVNKDLSIAIKADKTSPYPLVKNVLNTLQDLKQYRYHLVTTLEGS